MYAYNYKQIILSCLVTQHAIMFAVSDIFIFAIKKTHQSFVYKYLSVYGCTIYDETEERIYLKKKIYTYEVKKISTKPLFYGDNLLSLCDVHKCLEYNSSCTITHKRI